MIEKQKTLEKKIEENNLLAVNVNSLVLSNKVIVAISNIDDFLKFIINLDSKYVYYKYKYYDINEYLIPLDYFSEYLNDFRKAVNSHNQYLKSIDFEQPNELIIFTLINGTCLGTRFTHDWLAEQEIYEKDEQIEIIESNFQNEVNEIKEKSKMQKIEDTNFLRDYILSDENFKYLKNQRLREIYLVELLENDDFKKFNYLFFGSYNRLDRDWIKLFMDRTWMTYQSNQKK